MPKISSVELCGENLGTQRKKEFCPVAYPGILFGGVQQIQLRTEDRERGSGAVAPYPLVKGSGSSCNLV